MGFSCVYRPSAVYLNNHNNKACGVYAVIYCVFNIILYCITTITIWISSPVRRVAVAEFKRAPFNIRNVAYSFFFPQNNGHILYKACEPKKNYYNLARVVGDGEKKTDCLFGKPGSQCYYILSV